MKKNFGGEKMNNQSLGKKFDRQALLYEQERKLGLLNKWREKIIPFAHGEVLELAVGAGGNLPFYQKVVNITALDISFSMIERAHIVAKQRGLDVTFILGNAETISFQENQFDTIVSTLSFCGYDNPERMLNRACHWLKPGGTLLLFEHGISESQIIASIQNKVDPLAKRIIGCHQNRPMIKMIRELPIKIETHESFAKGIFHIVQATSLKPLR